MKRTSVPGLLDVIVVDEPSQIRAIAEDPRVDRIFVRRPFLNGLILRRRLSALSYHGTRFPHQQPKGDLARVERQRMLRDLYTLFLLKLGKADSDHTARDLVFMTGSWSRCPAERWVPGLMAGVWKRACMNA